MNSKPVYFKKGFPKYLTSHTNPEKMKKYMDIKVEKGVLMKHDKENIKRL